MGQVCCALAVAFSVAACAKQKPPPHGAAPIATSVANTTQAPILATPSTLLEPGAPAPEIEAVAQSGEKVKLSAFRGQPVVVYFYPKDDTPGCTAEAQGIRDDWAEIGKLHAVVLGVSTDDADSHKAFAAKYQLPFLLLPDTDQKIARAFGVPVTNGHAQRVTFVIDSAGKIAKVFPKVDPRAHAAELVTVLGSLPKT